MSKSERQLKEDIRRGEKAERIMTDPLVKQAIARMRADVMHNIENTNSSETEFREALYMMLKVIRKFEKLLDQHIRGKAKAFSLLEKLKIVKPKGVTYRL
jgi:hypothetical protein